MLESIIEVHNIIGKNHRLIQRPTFYHKICEMWSTYFFSKYDIVAHEMKKRKQNLFFLSEELSMILTWLVL